MLIQDDQSEKHTQNVKSDHWMLFLFIYYLNKVLLWKPSFCKVVWETILTILRLIKEHPWEGKIVSHISSPCDHFPPLYYQLVRWSN